MSITVEERVRRAAAQLDAAVQERHDGGTADVAYVADRHNRRRPAVVGVAAAVAAVVVAGMVLVVGDRRPTASVEAVAGQLVGSEGWTRLPASPLAPRFQHLAVSTGSGVLFWGGYDRGGPRTDGAYYNAVTHSWAKTPGAPLAADRGDAVGAWTGTEAVVVNGIDRRVKAAAYNPLTNSWRTLPDPPLDNAANMMTKAVAVDGVVVVVAVSEESERGVRNQVAVLDPATSEWRIGASPTAFGSGFDAVVVGSEVVVVGQYGMGGKGCGESVVTAYSPARDAWRPLISVPVVPAAVASVGSAIFVVGGACGESNVTHGYLLDISDSVWRPTAPPPRSVHGDMRYGEIFTGRVVVTFDDNGTPIFYKPATDQWIIGVASPLHRLLQETPWSLAGDQLVAFSGGVSEREGDGITGCCHPLDGGYTYTLGP